MIALIFLFWQIYVLEMLINFEVTSTNILLEPYLFYMTNIVTIFFFQIYDQFFFSQQYLSFQVPKKC